MSPEDLYLTHDGNLFFMDFSGLMRNTCVYIGNYNYAPHEYFTSKQTNDKLSDLWRLGVFIYELLTGIPPFWDNCEESTITRIRNVMYELPKFLSKQAKDLISKV